MSKKRNPLEDPPAASSSDDEEVESSAGEEEEEEDDSSSEEESPKPTAKAPSSSAVTIAVPGKTTLPAATPASDSESGSETETDSESEPEQPTNKGSGKAILTVTKPKNDKKSKSPPPPIALALPAKSGSKRPSEVASSTNTKRAKKDIVEEKKEDSSKKPGAFQRLWTEEDEIAVLQGMIDFKNETGKSPYDDTNVYYDYIKKSISFEVSKNQFMDKIRSLRKKYIGKEKPAFTKPHDQKSYRLCQYIWGPDGMGLESAVKSNGGGASKKSQKKTKKLDSVKQELSFGGASPNGKAVVVEDDDEKDVVSVAAAGKKRGDWFENSFLVKAIAGFGVDEECVKQRWSLVSGESKKKVGEKLKALQAKEIEFVLEKTEVLREVTSMIAEASKKN